MRTSPVASYLLAVALGAFLPGQDAAPAAKRPNILFLFADDQRPDAVHAFGNEPIETPNLDALANGGFRFAQNYCMGSWHGAVCQPSRAMLMSGRSLWRVKPALEGVHTLPQALAEVGYVTYGTGKWHNGRPSFLRSFAFGRSVMFGGMSDHNRVPIVDLDPATRKFGKQRAGEEHSSELFAGAAVSFLEQHARQGGGKPFFVYCAFTAPHDPRDPPVSFRETYYKKKLPMPANFKPQVELLADQSWANIRDEVLAPWPRTEAVIRDQLAEYYGLITHLDGQIGRILETLKATGQAENTVIVYAADHGLAVGSHGLLGKQSVYEHSMGCPLMLYGPGIPKGTSRALTYLLDLYPTLCGIAGAKVPESVEGKDLMPVARGEREGVRDTLFTAYRHTQRAVRDARYKLIRFPEIDKTLLYDLQEDPHELVDLGGRPEHAARVAALWKELEGWQQRLGDAHPLRVEEPRPAYRKLGNERRKPDQWQPQWIREKYFGGR